MVTQIVALYTEGRDQPYKLGVLPSNFAVIMFEVLVSTDVLNSSAIEQD